MAPGCLALALPHPGPLPPMTTLCAAELGSVSPQHPHLCSCWKEVSALVPHWAPGAPSVLAASSFSSSVAKGLRGFLQGAAPWLTSPGRPPAGPVIALASSGSERRRISTGQFLSAWTKGKTGEAGEDEGDRVRYCSGTREPPTWENTSCCPAGAGVPQACSEPVSTPGIAEVTAPPPFADLALAAGLWASEQSL